jgi:DNA repair protein RadC
MLLTRSNKAPWVASISKGGISGTVTDVRIILQFAIKANANSIIICHNHHSGNVHPSESDNAITRKVKESGNVMDIQLLDHLIIVSEGRYYSMADEGIILKYLITIIVSNSPNVVIIFTGTSCSFLILQFICICHIINYSE